MSKQEQVEARIAELQAKEPAAMAEYHAAWDLYCSQTDPDFDDPALAKEADRTAKNIHGIHQAIAAFKAQIDRMNHPAEIERANQTKTRLENMMASKTPKITARDQGFPEIYLAPNGNFRPGMDARAKSDLISAICEAKGDKPNPKAIHRFDLDTANHLIEARGWRPLVNKALANRAIKAERVEAKATNAKKQAAAKRASKTAKVQVPAPADDVTPDPKPARKPRSDKGIRRSAA